MRAVRGAYGRGRMRPVTNTLPSEHDEQCTVVTWFRQAYPQYAGCLYAVPNGGERHAAVAAKLRSEGVQAGVLDLCLRVPRGGAHGLYVEMKRQKATRSDVSDEQFADIGLCLRMGYAATWCAGAHEAAAVIAAYLGD